MNDLVEFLLARIAEDEAGAREASDVAAAPWQWEHLPPPLDYGLVGVHPIQGGATVIIPSRSGDMWPDRDTAAHIARWDPARVLAECEAKRRLIAATQEFDTDPKWDAFGAKSEYEQLILTNLALPYADHPDYRQDWKPFEEAQP